MAYRSGMTTLTSLKRMEQAMYPTCFSAYLRSTESSVMTAQQYSRVRPGTKCTTDLLEADRYRTLLRKKTQLDATLLDL